MKIGILGYGTVGQGVVKILRDRKENVAKLADPIEVKRICVRSLDKKREIAVDREWLTADASAVIEDEDIDLVVEVTSDKENSAQHMLQAMRNGKHVVTANKAAVAAHYAELVETAKVNDVQFRYEASVCGGIPVLSALEKLLPFNEIVSMRGIVNGSTNYVLSALSSEKPKGQIMREASAIGILEADPTDDIEGFDARRKLAILADLATGQMVDETELPKIGIERIDGEDVAHMARYGRKIKLIATYRKEIAADAFYANVLPTALPDGAMFATDGVANILCVEGSHVGKLHFYGPGGGMDATANAILTDIYDVSGMGLTRGVSPEARMAEAAAAGEKLTGIRYEGIYAGSRKLLTNNTAFSSESQYYLRGQRDLVLEHAAFVLAMDDAHAAAIGKSMTLTQALALYEKGLTVVALDDWDPNAQNVQSKTENSTKSIGLSGEDALQRALDAVTHTGKRA